MKVLEEVIIPKNFSIDNYNVTLKNDVEGVIQEREDGVFFKSYIDCVTIKLDNSFRLPRTGKLKPNRYISEVQKIILDIYIKFTEHMEPLSKYEFPIFYLIDDVKNTWKSSTMLFIGYKNNYVATIRKTLNRFNINCNTIELDKNIELYQDDYDSIFKKIIDKIESNKNYNKIIVDITNLHIKSNYNNTKRLLNYLKFKNMRILILLDGEIEKFESIFGTELSSNIIDRNLVIQAGTSNRVTNKILEVLF